MPGPFAQFCLIQGLKVLDTQWSPKLAWDSGSMLSYANENEKGELLWEYEKWKQALRFVEQRDSENLRKRDTPERWSREEKATELLFRVFVGKLDKGRGP